MASSTAKGGPRRNLDLLLQPVSKIDWPALTKSLFSHLNPQTCAAFARKAKDYAVAHPGMTTIQVISAVALFFPAVFFGPVLGLIGFSAVGPVAGSAAAGYQAINGATWGFRIMQSAAMGGYGTAAVGGIVQGFAVLGGVGAQGLKRLKRLSKAGSKPREGDGA